MLRITELRLPLDHPAAALRAAVLARLGLEETELAALHVHRAHHTVGQRLDGELHLHRLEPQQHRAAMHARADLRLDGGDGALHAGAVIDEARHGSGRVAPSL